MTKTELVQEIQELCDQEGQEFSKGQINSFLDGLAAAIQNSVNDVDKTTIPGVGRVSCTLREARSGRNPATGETIDIGAKVAVRITPAKNLKDAVPSVKKARSILSA